VRALLALIFVVVCLAWLMRTAAGRLAPRVALAPLVFLITRKAVLAAWLLGAAGFFALMWSSAVANGKHPEDNVLLLGGLSIFCGLGVAALVVGPLFMAIRAMAAPPVLELAPGERIVKDVAANHFLGGEARGGRLLLTNERIGFRPHRFNVQLATWSARVHDVRKLEREGDRFLVVHVDGSAKPEWLVVQGRDAIADAVAAALERRDAPAFAEDEGALGTRRSA